MVRVAPSYDIERIKRDLCTAIDRRARQLLDLSHAVHSRPELAFSEHWAAATLAGILEDADFRVQRAAFGLPTAFQATAGPASAGTIVICCEYDALPGIGHCCGHNVIAAASVGAAIALAPLARRLRGHLTL